MTKSMTSARAIGWHVVLALFACLSIAPNACLNATRIADLVPVRSLAAQTTVPNYTFTVIADLSNCSTVSSPVLNNKGQAAFVATCPEGRVIRRGDGNGSLTDIYMPPPGSTLGVLDNVISINDDEMVAFSGVDGLQHTILVGDGGPLTAVVDTNVHTQFKSVRGPSINNAGAVAFMAMTKSTEYDTVAIRNEDSFITIAEPGTVAPDIGVLTAATEPALNNHGVVAFIGQGPFTSGLLTGNGGPLAIISGSLFTNHLSMFNGINDLGRVGFAVAKRIVQIYVEESVQLAGGDPPISRSLASMEHYEDGVSINNASLVAYSKTRALPGGGVFVAPYNGTQAVIKPGDTIPVCGTVTSFGISEEAINDAAQVAIAVQCNRAGTVARAIVRADPIRQPTMTTLSVSSTTPEVGQPITLTAHVASASGVPSGQVQFVVDSASYLSPGPSTLINGVASIQWTAAFAWSFAISATFPGSDEYQPSISPSVLVIIDQKTTTTLDISPSSAVVGEPVTLRATVKAPIGVATGQVEFFDEATLVGAAPLVNGVATIETSALTAGSHRLLAVFKGSSGLAPSTSPAVPVTINSAPLQAPLNLRVLALVGNLVTFRWDVSDVGPRPTQFVIESGLTSAGVSASLLTGVSPILTVAAPPGAFYVRVHAVTPSERSGPSNEIRIFVNTPTAPSPPSNLLALVNGASLALTWQSTFAGGVATSHILNVTGAVNTSIPLGDQNSLTFSPVPAGTYTLSVSAVNAAGASGPSNVVTVTFPGTCSGVPLTPGGFLAYGVGNMVSVVWDPPASGAAPTQYVVDVTGAFVGSFSTTGTTMAGTVGSGAYGLRVSASNACGSSASTPVQTITIP